MCWDTQSCGGATHPNKTPCSPGRAAAPARETRARYDVQGSNRRFAGSPKQARARAIAGRFEGDQYVDFTKRQATGASEEQVALEGDSYRRPAACVDLRSALMMRTLSSVRTLVIPC